MSLKVWASMAVRCSSSNRESSFRARAAPVRCINAERYALSTCLRRMRAISFAQRPASHASRHRSSHSGSWPGATNTSPRSITAIERLRTSEMPSQAIACCSETTAERGRSAGELASRITSPVSTGSDWIRWANCAASVSWLAVSSASWATMRGKGAIVWGAARQSARKACALWLSRGGRTTDPRLNAISP